MDNAITGFINERKAERLKKKLNINMSEEDQLTIQRETDRLFDLENWLPDAARRAGQLSMVSHPSKFSHPSSKTSAIIATNSYQQDGYLRTGNIESELDVLGNAAALDVYKFLSLKMADGQSLLAHLEENSEYAQKTLSLKNTSHQTIREGLLSIKITKDDVKTSSLVKQVYFPAGNGYHLLSVMTPSGLMYEMRNRINAIRFNEQAKTAREAKRKNEVSDSGFEELFDLSMIGFGGTKPQNISVLNNQYGGKAYLLPSLPPRLTKQETKLPSYDFFSNCLWPNEFKGSFVSLHKLLAVDSNNINIRQGRDNIYLFVFDRIIEKIWRIRGIEGGWSTKERFNRLPKHQKLLLDSGLQADRDEDEDCLETFNKEIARWILNAYKKVLAGKALSLNDDELQHFTQLMTKHREVLL